MRLDKFLKVSRLIKRRTVAKEASESKKVTVNGKTAKPGTDLKIGDIIEIRYYLSTLKVKVKSLEEYARKEEALRMYEILAVSEHKEPNSD